MKKMKDTGLTHRIVEAVVVYAVVGDDVSLDFCRRKEEGTSLQPSSQLKMQSGRARLSSLECT